MAGVIGRAVLALLVALASPALAQRAAGGRFEWVTLGTQGGPVASLTRGQPANLLVRDGEAHLIDVGDGAATRMGGAGAGFPALRTIFISHIHFDHIGGLFGVLGLRLQTRVTRPLTIYGPPGTRRIVGGLVAAMQPSAESGFGVPGEVAIAADAGIEVVELAGGATVKLGDVTVRVAENSHYSLAGAGEAAARYKSLSYRFDLPDRSIVYTGDTGPSRAVEQLAKGADLLVTEMIDLPASLALMERRGAFTGPAVRAVIARHLSTHHLATDDIGKLARAAGVGKVIVTHLAAGGSSEPGAAARYVAEIKRHFSGPVTVASDGDRF